VLLSLLKFLIRTRFSRPFLILMVVVLVYAAAISQVVPSGSEDFFVGYYYTAIIAFLLAMSLITGGVMVFKSDRDYLFTLPLSQRDMSASIFFAQFIAFGMTVLFTSIYLVALAFVFTSLGILATSLSSWARTVLAAALAAWTLASVAGFPVSPGSAFNGNLYSGTATLIALSIVTTATAFRSLSHVELDMMRNLVRSTSSEVKSPNSYAGKTPLGAIYSMNLSSISLAGRMNMAGASRYVSRRVRTRWVVAATSIAAAAYVAFVVLEGPPSTFTAGSDSLPAAVLVAILLAFVSFFFSQSAIVNERIWLSLTSLPPATYFRHLVLSKLASFLLIVAPFAVANAALIALGYGEGLGALAVVALDIPGAFVLQILWSAYVAPIQVKGEDQSLQAQFSVRQLLAVLPLAPVFVLASVSTIVPEVALIGGLVLIGLSAVLMMSGRFWEGVVVRLTENGFV
jgi:hypothetical protein